MKFKAALSHTRLLIMQGKSTKSEYRTAEKAFLNVCFALTSINGASATKNVPFLKDRWNENGKIPVFRLFFPLLSTPIRNWEALCRIFLSFFSFCRFSQIYQLQCCRGAFLPSLNQVREIIIIKKRNTVFEFFPIIPKETTQFFNYSF